MASEAVLEFTDSNFNEEVLNSDVPVLVDFWAEWCQPCRMLAPTIDEVATDFNGKAKVGKLDTDANQEVAIKYDIQAIPTVLLFKGGEVEQKFVGMKSKDDFAAAINDILG